MISDVHGNRWALEAVLADIDRRGIEQLVNLGDCAYGPLDPASAARMLMSRNIPTVRGNEDRLITDPPAADLDSPTLRFVRRQLPAEQQRWLSSLPPHISLDDEVFLCHGTPSSDTEYLLWEVDGTGARARAPEQVAARIVDVPGSLVLCAHDHVQQALALPGGRTVVDPGSVGLPAFADDVPEHHVMQAGSPHARYTIVTRDREGWHAEPVSVDYDWESAAAAAERNGRPDWAHWLKTGSAI